MKMKPNRPARALGITIAVAAIAGSLVFVQMPGTGDMDMFWLPWIQNVITNGPIAAYGLSATDYPPLIFVPLEAIAAASLLGVSPFLALKIALWLCTWVTVGLFYMATRRGDLSALLAALLVVPSIALAYLDVFTMPALILAVWCIRKERFALGLFLLTVSCLTKWQPAILAPPFLIYTWHHLGWRRAIRAAVPSTLLVLVCVAVAGAEMLRSLQQATLTHTVISQLALNGYWLVTRIMDFNQGQFDANVIRFMEPPAATLRLLKLLFTAIYLRALFRFQPRTFEECLESAVTCVLLYLAFNPGVHESHLLTALVPAVWLVKYGRQRYLAVAAVANLNILLFYGVSGGSPYIRVPFADLIIALGVVAFVVWHLGDLRERWPQLKPQLITGAADEKVPALR